MRHLLGNIGTCKPWAKARWSRGRGQQRRCWAEALGSLESTRVQSTDWFEQRRLHAADVDGDAVNEPGRGGAWGNSDEVQHSNSSSGTKTNMAAGAGEIRRCRSYPGQAREARSVARKLLAAANCADPADVEELRAAQKIESDALVIPVHGENRQGKMR